MYTIPVLQEDAAKRLYVPKGLQGVELKGDQVLIDESYKEKHVADILKRIDPDRVVHRIGSAKVYSPTDSDREKIRSMVGSSANVDNFGIYHWDASDNTKDEYEEIISAVVLQEMAVQYGQGRSFLFMHDSQHGIGQTFEAQVVPVDVRQVLQVKTYVLDTAKLQTDLAKNLIDGGVYSRVSVGFRAWLEYIPADDPDMFGTWIYSTTDDLVVRELSLVDMGANTNAIRKSASNNLNGPIFGPLSTTIKSITMAKRTITLKSLNNRNIEVEDTTAAILEEMDAANLQQNDAIKKLQKTIADRMKRLQDRFVALNVQLDADADKTKLEERAKALTETLLEDDIQELEEKVRVKKAAQLVPGKKKLPVTNGNEDDKQEEKVPYTGSLADIKKQFGKKNEGNDAE